ncbi:MAG: 16S rRNA (adenine(1518)-N(6)/adenine(1519)-N(6))-dimethyltransferase RsmA [Acidimicrobiales bacterium]
MTLTRRQTRDLLAEHDFHPAKSRGQNFVADPNTVRRIARLASVGPGDQVVEIGAGLGALTLALAETGARVVTVEVDHRLVAILQGTVPEPVTVVEGDALTLDWPALLGTEPGRWVLVANLPYNIATPLVLDLLAGVPAIGRMLVMVQREAGERLAATPGSAGYGAVSVKVAYRALARVEAKVPSTVFVPQPEVESVLVSLRRRDRPAVDLPAERLFPLVEAGFGHRRKMLRRSLEGLVTADDFSCAGVEPTARAEELDVVAWGRLAACRLRS